MVYCRPFRREGAPSCSEVPRPCTARDRAKLRREPSASARGMPWRGVLIGALLSLIAGGCSRSDRPAVIPVSGTITYNGTPVDGAIVSFSSAVGNPAATAITDGSGKYVLHTFTEADGAAPGDYVVTITKVVADDPMAGKTTDEVSKAYAALRASGKPIPQMVVKYLVPQKYATAQDSPEKATVKDGEPNVIDFKLTD